MAQVLWISLAFLLAVAVTEASRHGDICAHKICKAGRECKVVNNEAMCQCVRSCPEHFSPVCGSNGRSYDNHCLMHREACLEAIHIRVKHKGYCKKTQEEPIKKKPKSQKLKEKPVVCFQTQRDQLHSRVAAFMRKHDKSQPWYNSAMTEVEILWARFFTCDGNRDNYLDANEFLECIKNVTIHFKPEANSDLIRALCVDAIINSGDTDSDWRLSFDEFKHSMSPHFKPKNKTCSLEGKYYQDGAETIVDCNDCICACGNWVCTSSVCQDKFEDPDLNDEDEDEDEEDDIIKHQYELGHKRDDKLKHKFKKSKDKHHMKELSHNHV